MTNSAANSNGIPLRKSWTKGLREIYAQVNCTLLSGVYEGVGIYFYEIAKISRDELDGFRDRPEEYLFERFGGGNFKLNFYEGPSFVVCVNFKPKGEPKWKHLIKKTPSDSESTI